jgi:hypothetical protein
MVKDHFMASEALAIAQDIVLAELAFVSMVWH